MDQDDVDQDQAEFERLQAIASGQTSGVGRGNDR
jgi:hypothetical protein